LFVSLFGLTVLLLLLLDKTQVIRTLLILILFTHGFSHTSHGILYSMLALGPLGGTFLILLIEQTIVLLNGLILLISLLLFLRHPSLLLALVFFDYQLCVGPVSLSFLYFVFLFLFEFFLEFLDLVALLLSILLELMLFLRQCLS
jgi:hypothetical protein